MYFKIFSWSSALLVLVTFITKEDLLSVIKGSQETSLPPLNFTINATSNCIEVSHSNAVETGALNLLLSDTPFEDFLIPSSINLENNEKTLLNSSNPSTFCNLNPNSTYYLYYYQQDLKSSSFSQSVQTKPLEVQPLVSSTHNNPIIALISILVTSFTGLFAYIHKRVHNKHSKACSSANKKCLQHQHSPSPKISSSNIDIKQLKKITKMKIQEFEDKSLCGLCCDRPREVIFLECGHIYACGKCAKNLYQCPLDKKYITKKLHFRICDKFGINANYVNELEVNSLKARHYDHLGLCYDKVKEYLDEAKKYELLKEKFDNYNYFEKCIICNQQRKDTFFADCGHLVCCRNCSETVNCCPIDRVNLTHKAQVYYA